MEKQIEYHDIILTDIKLHTVRATNPPSLARVITKSVRNGLPGRIYSKLFSMKKTDLSGQDRKFQVTIPLTKDLQETIAKIEKAGKKVRIFMPKGGLPVYAGKDTVEFMNGKKNRWLKRI